MQIPFFCGDGALAQGRPRFQTELLAPRRGQRYAVGSSLNRDTRNGQ
jgi:hypothetical protein